jgi:hypothetical protein
MDFSAVAMVCCIPKQRRLKNSKNAEAQRTSIHYHLSTINFPAIAMVCCIPKQRHLKNSKNAEAQGTSINCHPSTIIYLLSSINHQLPCDCNGVLHTQTTPFEK